MREERKSGCWQRKELAGGGGGGGGGRFPLPRTCVRGRTRVRAFAQPRGAQPRARTCARARVCVCVFTGGWIGNAHAPTAENLPSQGKSASETRRGCVPLCYIQCRVGERSPQRSLRKSRGAILWRVWLRRTESAWRFAAGGAAS